MSNILFRMINGEQKVHFQTDEATPETQLALIKGIFAALGVAAEPIMTIQAEPLMPASPFALEDNVAPLRSMVIEEAPRETAASLMQKQIREVTAAKKEIATTSTAVQEIKDEPEQPKFRTSIAERMEAKRPAWLEADTQIEKATDATEEVLDFGFHYVTNEALSHSATDDTEVPEHFKTGIKIGPLGESLYKLRYWCGRCSFKGNHYIPEDTKTVDCYNCNSTLAVHKAVPRTIMLEPDAFKNWFIAGLQKPVRIVTQEQYTKLKSRGSR